MELFMVLISFKVSTIPKILNESPKGVFCGILNSASMDLIPK